MAEANAGAEAADEALKQVEEALTAAPEDDEKVETNADQSPEEPPVEDAPLGGQPQAPNVAIKGVVHAGISVCAVITLATGLLPTIRAVPRLVAIAILFAIAGRATRGAGDAYPTGYRRGRSCCDPENQRSECPGAAAPRETVYPRRTGCDHMRVRTTNKGVNGCNIRRDGQSCTGDEMKGNASDAVL